MATAETNHWLDERCARAFWDQNQAIPYQELLRDTAAWMAPAQGENWLDLGCGAGRLSAELYRLADGRVTITAMDCNPANDRAIDTLRQRLHPSPHADQLRYVVGNFSDGLPQFGDAAFDGVVSGLAISYAEWKDPTTGRYTDRAYNQLLAEIYRVLRPGGRLVFSVNVPRPAFWRILWKSLGAVWTISRPLRALRNGLRMQWYGHWLRRQASRGRFHYFPIEQIGARLEVAGFETWRYRLSYAGQAYLIEAQKAMASQAT
jgi:ubiquinone/menaquinone biosynthesis C-methylase UbiE